jgi:hypothetical protein
MEISDEGSEANIAFWKTEFGKFVYAETEAEAVSVLVNALRSEKAMPDILRLILADMLETGGVRGTIEPSWRIKIVMRRDTAQTKARLEVYAACKAVQRFVEKGMPPAVACREVAKNLGRGKTQRGIEMAYQAHLKLMDRALGETKRRVEAAMQRSQALRQSRRYGGQLEEDQGS